LEKPLLCLTLAPKFGLPTRIEVMGLQIPITESPSLKSSARRPGLDKADIAVRHHSLDFEMAVDRHQQAPRKAAGRFVDDSPLEGGVSCELVSANGRSPISPA
jgi:hypothetical protein